MTRLIEFKNHKGETLRGLIDTADSSSGTKTGVVFVHGFERTSIETKFKNIVNELKGETNLFRFDFSGNGLSDGKFEDITVAKMKGELKAAINAFKREIPHLEKINIAAHSLGASVALDFINENPGTISKSIFISPAFNQKNLHRYWFVKNTEGKKREISWNNYREYFSEEKFQEDLRIGKRMVKSHCLRNNYYLENEKIDYQDLFSEQGIKPKNFLIIIGLLDDKVPPESNDKLPNGIKIIKVANGDHDLERPDSISHYLKNSVDFLR